MYLGLMKYVVTPSLPGVTGRPRSTSADEHAASTKAVELNHLVSITRYRLMNYLINRRTGQNTLVLYELSFGTINTKEVVAWKHTSPGYRNV